MSKQVEDVLFQMVDTSEGLELEYAVLGGLAVRVHGIPRPTFDVDLQLTVTGDQLTTFLDRMVGLGYTVPAAYRSGWRDEVGGMPLVKLCTYLQEGCGIDVDLFLNETPFQHSIMQRRMRVEMAGRQLNVVSPEDLVLLKLVANRPRDLGDVSDIVFVQGQLDETYMRHWAQILGISDRLETALRAN